MDTGTPEAEFARVSRNSLLNHYWPKIKVCVECLSQDDIDWRPSMPPLPSIGDVFGRLSDLVFLTIAACSSEVQDCWPPVSSSNSPRSGRPKEVLIADVERELEVLAGIISRLSPDALAAKRMIAGRESTLMETVMDLSAELANAFGEISQLASSISGRRSRCDY